MKLANHLTIRLSAFFLVIMLIWSVIYFFMQMHEIYDDIDEGLINLKQEFILKASSDSEFVEAMEKYDPINMIVRQISYDEAIQIEEKHITIQVYFETEKEYEEVRLLQTAFRSKANGKYYSLKFFTSTVETDDLIENMLILLIALWLVLGILLIVVGKKIINRSTKPFYQLLSNLDQFNLNRSEMIKLPKTNISEFKTLNKTIESLLKENIQTYKEQKTFIENASHELQTPLTIVISKIELMMNNQSTNEQQMQELSSILASLNRMKRLNSNLLLLTKIKNKQFIDISEVNIKEITDEVIDNFSDIIEHKKISLNINITNSPLKQMNRDLAYIMIANLMKNAINYNILNGNINIELTNSYFVISNDGEPLTDNINIFERYTSKSSTGGSTGLGLAIVSSIIELYNFEIGYSYTKRHNITIIFQENN